MHGLVRWEVGVGGWGVDVITAADLRYCMHCAVRTADAAFCVNVGGVGLWFCTRPCIVQ